MNECVNVILCAHVIVWDFELKTRCASQTYEKKLFVNESLLYINPIHGFELMRQTERKCAISTSGSWMRAMINKSDDIENSVQLKSVQQ